MSGKVDDPGLGAAFERGDYHRVAAGGSSGNWRTFAALGLCGRTGPALERLADFAEPEARFYEGVIQWIHGDEAAAVRILEPLDDAYADSVLNLIRKPRISILSQLSWYRSGDGVHNVLQGGEIDPKFDIRNISFAPEDLTNRPNANIHDYYDSASPPDFYLAEMIEWHVIPPNLQELPCPIIGQTGDYDLHIQTILPWLRLFDEILVSDSTEYADLQGLVDAPVTTYCKPLSLPPNLPDPIACEKELDIIVTGTLLHSYYPDKAEMIRQILGAEDIEPVFYSGFFQAKAYYPILARTRMAIALTRHLGAIPSRGFEALAMGVVLLAPHESCLRLFVDNDDGIVPYSLEGDGLRHAMDAVRADYDRHAAGAQRAMESIRAEFEPWRSSSQYLRMAAFRAARPRPPRRSTKDKPLQMRSVAFKGHLQAGGEQTYHALRKAALETWKSTEEASHSMASFTLPARELLLEYEFGMLLPPKVSLDPLIGTVFQLFAVALERFPLSLALRFNIVRTAFHFGRPAEIENAIAITEDCLAADPQALSLHPMDDVMPWDFCQNFFNYRSYLQIATEAMRDRSDRSDRSEELKALIFASLHYYYGRITDSPTHFKAAATLDPEFSVYRMWQAKALGRSDAPDEAIDLLSGVVGEILYAPEAWSLIQTLKAEYSLAVPGEQALGDLVAKYEDCTLIDDSYLAIRIGPYHRAQRLKLARNKGYEYCKKPEHKAPVALSILLADTNGCRYRALLGSLSEQTIDRSAYEIIVCDVFDFEASHVLRHADTLIVCGQDENLYNRNAAFNRALVEAEGSLVLFCNADVPLPETALAAVVAEVGAFAAEPTVLVNPRGTDRHSIHTVCLTRAQAIAAGGLDETAYLAGAYGGPYELVERLTATDWTIREFAAFPAASTDDAVIGKRPLPDLIREFWPDKFAPDRVLPLRENAEIAMLRASLR